MPATLPTLRRSGPHEPAPLRGSVRARRNRLTERDFSDIVTYPPAHYRGIVAVQLHNHPEIIPQLMTRLVAFFQTHPDPAEYAGKLFIVEVHRIRIRQ